MMKYQPNINFYDLLLVCYFLANSNSTSWEKMLNLNSSFWIYDVVGL